MNVTAITQAIVTSLSEYVDLKEDIRMDKTEDIVKYEVSSEVILSSSWSRLLQLAVLAFLAIFGSIGNVFMISALVIEEKLKKIGNGFLVSIGLADLLVTGLLTPMFVGVVLTEYELTLKTCRFQWSFEVLCFLVTVHTFMLVAIENYARLCLPREKYKLLTASRVTVITVGVWLIAGIIPLFRSSVAFGTSFCQQNFDVVMAEQVLGAIIFVVVPAVTTIILYGILFFYIRRATRGSYKPPIAFARDYELIKVNMSSFVMFLIFWLPFGIALWINTIRPINPHVIYALAWLAFSKSCFNNLLYFMADRHFRNAYVKLFRYCCCKTTVKVKKQRINTDKNSNDVRLKVHIIHSYANPTFGKSTVDKPNEPEAYEL
ncbi:histamine H2 receptor-like [Vespula squamosa]|uniref:Histamine H2 receptor-like n=1 Tax=Vespula squamosa TaxID=30214 RepID=A0ABD2AHJ8_VESSQ